MVRAVRGASVARSPGRSAARHSPPCARPHSARSAPLRRRGAWRWARHEKWRALILCQHKAHRDSERLSLNASDWLEQLGSDLSWATELVKGFEATLYRRAVQSARADEPRRRLRCCMRADSG